MSTFLAIMFYASLVFIGLSVAALVFVLLAKFLTDIQEDPDAASH